MLNLSCSNNNILISGNDGEITAKSSEGLTERTEDVNCSTSDEYLSCDKSGLDSSAKEKLANG